jgi:hypothetical protein
LTRIIIIRNASKPPLTFNPPTIERRQHLGALASAHLKEYQEFSFSQDWEIIRDLCEARPAESKK